MRQTTNKKSIGGAICSALALFRLAVQHKVTLVPLKRVNAGNIVQNALVAYHMGGIETWRDGLKFILMGCTNLQVTTSVMQYGYRIIDDMLDGLSRRLSPLCCRLPRKLHFEG